MFYGQIKNLFCSFLILICVGAICVSCSFFIADDGSSPPETTETDEPPIPCDPVSAESIVSLQFEETASAEKTRLVESFAELDDENLQSCFQAATSKEVIGLTILDLSRHTNSSLMEKAQALLERFDITVYVEGEIKSEDEERQQNIVNFLLRIESDQAEKVLAEMSFETDEQKNLITEQVFNGVSQVLIPTASEKGDRYYVQASWDPADQEQVSCLTNLFNKELAAQRTLEQEEQKMKELNGKRWVYWYSKDWALSIADAIRKCGSEASFVSGAAFVSGPTPKSHSDCCQPASTIVSDPSPEDETPPEGPQSHSDCCQSATTTVSDPPPEGETPSENPDVETGDSDGDALQKWDSNSDGRIIL